MANLRPCATRSRSAKGKIRGIALLILALLVTSSGLPLQAFAATSSSIAINGATVSVSGGPGDGFAITTASGAYSISSGLPTGTYEVDVSDSGYLSNQTMNVNLTSGQTLTLNVYLSRSGAVSGRVTFSNGSAVAKTEIFAESGGAGGNSSFGDFATTDSNGNYLMNTDLGTATYNVTAGLEVKGYVEAVASGVSITAGVETKNLNLVLQKSGTITGTVTFANGTAASGASVLAYGQGQFGSATTAKDGTFTIDTDLATGTYEVIASGDNGFGSLPGVNVTGGQTTANVNVQLQPSSIPIPTPGQSGKITGSVRDKTTGQPIPDAGVEATGSTGASSNTTDSNGDYVIETGLNTGTYTVNASAAGYSSGSVTGVSVTVGSVTPNVNFQLQQVPQAQSATIQGMVKGDANPVPEFPGGPALPLLIAVAAVLVALRFTNVFRGRFRPSLAR